MLTLFDANAANECCLSKKRIVRHFQMGVQANVLYYELSAACGLQL